MSGDPDAPAEPEVGPAELVPDRDPAEPMLPTTDPPEPMLPEEPELP